VLVIICTRILVIICVGSYMCVGNYVLVIIRGGNCVLVILCVGNYQAIISVLKFLGLYYQNTNLNLVPKSLH